MSEIYYCWRCGKELKGYPRYWVNTTTANKVVPVDYHGNDSNRTFPIGPECRKHYSFVIDDKRAK